MSGYDLFGNRKFSPGVFFAETPRFFQRASVNFSQFPALLSRVWPSNAGLAIEYETLVAFSFLAESFLIFRQAFG